MSSELRESLAWYWEGTTSSSHVGGPYDEVIILEQLWLIALYKNDHSNIFGGTTFFRTLILFSEKGNSECCPLNKGIICGDMLCVVEVTLQEFHG